MSPPFLSAGARRALTRARSRQRSTKAAKEERHKEKTRPSLFIFALSFSLYIYIYIYGMSVWRRALLTPAGSTGPVEAFVAVKGDADEIRAARGPRESNAPRLHRAAGHVRAERTPADRSGPPLFETRHSRGGLKTGRALGSIVGSNKRGPLHTSRATAPARYWMRREPK